MGWFQVPRWTPRSEGLTSGGFATGGVRETMRRMAQDAPQVSPVGAVTSGTGWTQPNNTFPSVATPAVSNILAGLPGVDSGPLRLGFVEVALLDFGTPFDGAYDVVNVGGRSVASVVVSGGASKASVRFPMLFGSGADTWFEATCPGDGLGDISVTAVIPDP